MARLTTAKPNSHRNRTVMHDMQRRFDSLFAMNTERCSQMHRTQPTSSLLVNTRSCSSNHLKHRILSRTPISHNLVYELGSDPKPLSIYPARTRYQGEEYHKFCSQKHRQPILQLVDPPVTIGIYQFSHCNV